MRGNHLERAARHLNTRMREVASDWVAYRVKKTGAVYRMRATKGSSVHQGDSATGGLITWESVDWFISYADLPVTPERGDTIEWTPPGRTGLETYEVINPLSENHYSVADEYKYAMRIHTQKITVN